LGKIYITQKGSVLALQLNATMEKGVQKRGTKKKKVKEKLVERSDIKSNQERELLETEKKKQEPEEPDWGGRILSVVRDLVGTLFKTAPRREATHVGKTEGEKRIGIHAKKL